MDKETKAQRSVRNKTERAAMTAARDALAATKLAESQALRAARASLCADAREIATQLVPTHIAIRTANELRAVTRTLTPYMIQRLFEKALGDGNEAVAAANILLDRGWGKPIQPTVALPSEVFMEMEEGALDAYLMKNTAKYIEGQLAEVKRPEIAKPVKPPRK